MYGECPGYTVYYTINLNMGKNHCKKGKKENQGS